MMWEKLILLAIHGVNTVASSWETCGLRECATRKETVQPRENSGGTCMCPYADEYGPCALQAGIARLGLTSAHLSSRAARRQHRKSLGGLLLICGGCSQHSAQVRVQSRCLICVKTNKIQILGVRYLGLLSMNLFLELLFEFPLPLICGITLIVYQLERRNK